MAANSAQQSLRLDADTETVEDLVDLVRRGGVRVPSFQRGLRWEADDVVALFDSIYRNYPIGSFLLRKGGADAARIQIGPLIIDAPDSPSALWVVDGQQRLTALTAGLARPVPIPSTPIDPWVVYFDAAAQRFLTPSKAGGVPSTSVPVPQLLDASLLSEWVHNWQHGGDAALRAVVFQAGTRIRQYQIPLYIVETNDEQLLRDIFYRINNFGRSLRWDEVHDALFGRKGGHPSTLPELGNELEKLGMGKPEEEQLLSCLLSFKGLDVTRNVAEHYRRDQEVLEHAVQDSLPALRRALSFLKLHAEIPHLRLLPRSLPLVILTRFFALYPEPKARTLTLLTRWTWRVLLGSGFYDERTLLRHGIAAISYGDEEQSAVKLLSLVPKELRAAFVLPHRFDARAADTRIALLGMSSLNPLSIRDGKPIDVASLIEARDVAAFRRILPREDALGSSPANRILLPGSGAARKEILDLSASARSDKDSILTSHGVSPQAGRALTEGRLEFFLSARKASIEEAIECLSVRLAAWAKTDRPSIAYLLKQTGASR